jgi:hypothetical protein
MERKKTGNFREYGFQGLYVFLYRWALFQMPIHVIDAYEREKSNSYEVGRRNKNK